MAFGPPHQIVVAQVVNTTGAVAQFSAGGDTGGQVHIVLQISAVGGVSPTLDIKLQWSHDGGVTFCDTDTVDSFVQITGAKNVIKSFPIRGPDFQLFATVGGSGGPTFTVSAFAYMTSS
jgi:hypothetical protein